MSSDSSAPTAFAARPATTRSITRPSRVSAPRSCARCARLRDRRRRAGRCGSSSGATRASRASGSSASSARGVHSEGAAITTAGVIPTPAIAYVTRAMGFDAGLVISASHNPFEDNGIKVFSGTRREVHRDARARRSRRSSPTRAGRCRARADAAGRSHGRHRRLHRARAAGAAGAASGSGAFKLAIDTANGATTTVAPRLFRGARASTSTVLSASPDGRNINLDCGSTHPERLSRGRARARLPDGRRVRRRRRPRDLRRRDGPRRRRRRRAADVRAAPAGRRAG